MFRFSRPRTFMRALVFVAVSAMAAAPAWASDSGAADPLADMNALFRSEYAAARSDVLAGTDPVIICAFDDLILYHDGTKTSETFTPPLYEQVKAVAHLPLALYVMLARYTGKPIDQGMLDQLAALRAAAVTAEGSFAGRPGWDAGLVDNNKEIVAAALALIDAATADKTISAAGLTDFARRMRPLILRNVDVAAKAQLDALNALVGKWRAELGDEAWQRAEVVVLTVRQARQGNLQYAYFQHVMGHEAEGVRLFVAENIFTADDALRLLGTILLDRGAGIAFFDSTTRLERDLLSDAAAAYVKTLPTDPPPPTAE